MNIELRNLKHFASGSEETECFTATIYVDGKKVGDASNDGHGGQTRVHLPAAIYEAVKAHALTQPDPSEFEVVEGFIDQLVSDALIVRDLKRTLSKSFLYTVGGKRGVFATKGIKDISAHVAQGEAVFRAKVKSWKVQPVKVLNFLPFDEAFAIYKNEPGA